jgi:hypothetical protein
MDVWKLTLLQFMGGTTQGTDDVMNPVDPLLESLGTPAWIGPIETLPDKPEFATATANRPGARPANQVLLERTKDGWNPIGAYVNETIALKDEHRGKGLSTELILRCSKHRDPPAGPRRVTKSGYAALAKAHYVAVERAIADRLAVPDNVKDEHRKRQNSLTSPPPRVSAAVEVTKRCSGCGESIPASAIVCRQCRSFQGRWWWFHVIALGLPWFIVFASLGALALNKYWESTKTIADVSATLESSEGDGIVIDVVNSFSSPIFLAAPEVKCGRPSSPEDWLEFENEPGHAALLLAKNNVPLGRLAAGDYARLEYTLGPGLDRNQLSKLLPNVICNIMFNYMAIPGLLTGRGIPLQGDLAAMFLRGERWAP